MHTVYHNINIPFGSFTVPIVMFDIGWSIAVATEVVTLLMGVADVGGVNAPINSSDKRKIVTINTSAASHAKQ